MLDERPYRIFVMVKKTNKRSSSVEIPTMSSFPIRRSGSRAVNFTSSSNLRNKRKSTSEIFMEHRLFLVPKSSFPTIASFSSHTSTEAHCISMDLVLTSTILSERRIVNTMFLCLRRMIGIMRNFPLLIRISSVPPLRSISSLLRKKRIPNDHLLPMEMR